MISEFAQLKQQMKRETIFSRDRAYRYTLWREWTVQELSLTVAHDIDPRPFDYVQFIGLNPSIADERIDDRTICRCTDFAKRWGFGAFCMTNLFAWRDTKPANMKRVVDPVGPENDSWLEAISKDAGLVVACWGIHGDHRDRAKAVLDLPAFRTRAEKQTIFCFGLTDDGHPKHPLMLKKLTELEPLRVPTPA